MSLSRKDRTVVVKQWNGIKETNTATGSDKEWQKQNAETTGASLTHYLWFLLIPCEQGNNKKKKKLSRNVRKRTFGHVRPAKIQISLRIRSNTLNNNNLHITKTRLFKYIENFTSKNWKFSEKNSDISIFQPYT